MIDRNGTIHIGRRLYYALLIGMTVNVVVLAIIRIAQQPLGGS